MSAESPTEYVQKLEAENRALRRQIVQLVAERQTLEQQLAMANLMYLRSKEQAMMDDLLGNPRAD